MISFCKYEIEENSKGKEHKTHISTMRHERANILSVILYLFMWRTSSFSIENYFLI